MYQNVVCDACGEAIRRDDREHVSDPYDERPGHKVWHFRCLPLDLVASQQVRVRSDDLARCAIWHISRLTKANTALRQRTDALAYQLERLMWASGASEEEVGDFRAEFSIYDDGAGPTG